MFNSLPSETRGLTARYVLWGLPIVYFCIAVTFYLGTYDSAQVKITITQMGITALAGLWLMEKIEDRHLGLSADYLPAYAPFFAFLASGIFSFAIQAPYKWTNLDEFVRRLLYMSVAVMILDCLKSLKASERILKFLIWALFASCFYGFIQLLDTRFFPPNPARGLDPFSWRHAFGTRIFSTFGNPNFFANYIVFGIPLVISWAFCKKSFAAWCALILALINIYFTATKGSWIGLAICLYAWVNLYGLFIPTRLAGFVKARLISALILVVTVVTMIFIMAPVINQSSIPFRVATWLSTFEMIKEHPVSGAGMGSFKVIYPAYRRPLIFHLEGKHNTETDHVENEHIETLFDEGILGFGIYIWLIFSVVFLSIKALNRWKKISGKIEPRAYHLIGVLAGWLGMLAHNNFDVSMRFVSSGVYMGLLPALAVSLAVSDRTWRDQGMVDLRAVWRQISWHKWALYGAKLLGLAAIAFIAVNVAREFHLIQTQVLKFNLPGNDLMVGLAWIFFALLMTGGCYFYIRSILKTKSVVSALVPIAMIYPLLFFWGWFKGDVHHNLGIVSSKSRAWNEAIRHYHEVNTRNPGFIMAYYFLGNVFNDRFDMTKKNIPEWGDPPGVERTDFDRAIGVYDFIRKNLAPNYVQMHFHVGNLFLKRAEWGRSNGESPEKIQEFYEKAVERYRLYQLHDPVFPDNFYRLGFTLTRVERFDEAADELKKRILAFKCGTHYPFGRAHIEPEDFMNLANTYLMGGRYNRAVATYSDYLKHISPNQPQIQHNLAMLLTHREAILQQIKSLSPSTAPAASYGIRRSRVD